MNDPVDVDEMVEEYLDSVDIRDVATLINARPHIKRAFKAGIAKAFESFLIHGRPQTQPTNHNGTKRF